MNNEIIIKQGNWEEHIKNCSDKSIDLIFCDLPYATNSFGKCINCEWDTPIDLKKMWIEFKRVRRNDNTPIFMCCNMKLAVDLITTNKKEFRYDLIWVKSSPCGFLNARRMPMKKHETVLVFYKKLPLYDLSSHTHKFIKKEDSILKKFTPEELDDLKEKAISCNIIEEPIKNKEQNILNKDNQKLDVELNIQINDKTFKNINLNTDCYNMTKRLKSGKMIRSNIRWTPVLPSSVIETDSSVYGLKLDYRNESNKLNGNGSRYNPPLPTSLLEYEKEYDETVLYNKHKGLKLTDEIKNQRKKDGNAIMYEPPLPLSVVENETMNTLYGEIKIKELDKPRKDRTSAYEPPLPLSVVNQEKTQISQAQDKGLYGSSNGGTIGNVHGTNYEPPLPLSVVDDIIDAPDSLLRIKSKKGKHSTQKPVDLMKWVFKYYSKENDKVLDICMGSGSTGVACVQMNRQFEGYELDENIYKVAEQRILIDKK